MAEPAPAPPAPPRLSRALVLAGLLFAIDGLWLGQGVVSGLVGFGLLLIGLPRALFARHPPLRRARLRNLGVYAGAVALVIGLAILNGRVAHERAEGLVAAIDAFHAQHRRYPKSLGELVPAHIAKVPPARLSLSFDQFTYLPAAEGPVLLYTALPPYGRQAYSFAQREWRFLD